MPRKSQGAGRVGALEETRALLALVASLSEAGDALTAEAVASKLGVSHDHAEKLIELVLTSSFAGGARLPLVEDERGGEVTMFFSEGVRGRQLRLTHTETVALLAALDRLGVDADDHLRHQLEANLSTDPVDRRIVQRVASSGAEGESAKILETIARARTLGRPLLFSYTRLGEKGPEERHVSASQVFHENDLWYLEGYDLDRQGMRTFRVDRMSDVLLGERVDDEIRIDWGAAPNGSRDVELTFSDPRYLDLFEHHGLKRVGAEEDGSIRCRIFWFGDEWLVRMVCACSGTITTNDAELNALVFNYARTSLKRHSS